MRAATFASALALFALPSASAQAIAPKDPILPAAAALRDAALADDGAYRLTETIVTEFGPRPMGSPSQHRASQWAAAQFRAMGFDRVSVEAFPVQAWLHGEQSAAVISPFPQDLSVVALGGTVPTPAGGVEGEIAIFQTFDALLAAPIGSLTGKIAVLVEPMPKFANGDGYFNLGRNRSSGAIEAAKRGAVAYLVRSLSTAMTRAPHTGGLRYANDVLKIPAAALAPPDAVLLDRMAARGKPVRLRLSVAPIMSDQPAEAHNIVADIVGREKPNEIVLIGAHIDSWGTTPGAVDNASGVAIVMSAARLIKQKIGRPKRTIRVVIFGAEEVGGASGRAYAERHDKERPSYVLASESDSGAAYVQEIKLPGSAALGAFGTSFAALIEPLGTTLSKEPSTYGGVDVNRLRDVPLVSVRADLTDYFDVHHGADDTMDKIDSKGIRRSVAAWAVLTYMAAESGVDFRTSTPSKD